MSTCNYGNANSFVQICMDGGLNSDVLRAVRKVRRARRPAAVRAADDCKRRTAHWAAREQRALGGGGRRELQARSVQQHLRRGAVNEALPARLGNVQRVCGGRAALVQETAGRSGRRREGGRPVGRYGRVVRSRIQDLVFGVHAPTAPERRGHQQCDCARERSFPSNSTAAEFYETNTGTPTRVAAPTTSTTSPTNLSISSEKLN